jgi:putative inorganic carbon (HCO3(-)) transporter
MRGLLFIVFLVYAALLMVRPQEFMPALQQTPLLQIVLLTAFVIWLFSSDKGLEHPQIWLLIPFMMIVWFGMGLAGWWGGITKAIDKLLPPLLLFVISSGAVRSVVQLRIFMVFLIAGASIITLHGHWQLLTGVGWTGAEPIEGRITYSGIFNDPNDIGLLLVVAIASIIYLLGQTTSFLLRLALIAALGWMGYGVYLTDSRGTLLATLCVLGFYLWRRYGKGAVIAAGLAAVPVLLATTRLAELNADEDSAEGRLDAWYEGILMLLHYPLFGVGYSNFVDHHNLTAHNSMVLAMAELGFVGYTVWLAIVGYSLYMLYWLTFRYAPLSGSADSAPSPEVKREIDASRALFAAMLGFCFGAFFLSQSYKYLLFMMCGLALGRYMGAQAVLGPLPKRSFLSDLPRWIGLNLASVIGLYILLKLTL